MIEVAVTDLARHELAFAAGVLSRGMRDNPVNIAIYGGDPLWRLRALERTFASFLPLMKRLPLAARRGDWVVGICGMAPPGTCQLSPPQMLPMLPSALRNGPGAMVRGLRLFREWKKRDPKEAHWHLGPVAVEPGLQGIGIGSQMMERFCAMMDAERELAYLETDKPENVRFYEKFGFETIAEAEVLGVRSWFMWRRPVGQGAG